MIAENSLPHGWCFKSLHDLATINYGKSPKDILSQDGNIPVLGTGGVERYGNDYLYDGVSIILGRKGTIDKVAYIDGKFWVTDTAYFLSGFRNVNIRWLFYFLQTINFRLMNEATGVPSLSRDHLYKIQVTTPSIEEQEKIATILTIIDQAIEKTEAIITKQQCIKSGLMQDLLTLGIDVDGNLRSKNTHKFKDSPIGKIPLEWTIETLGTLAVFNAGYAFKNKELSDNGWRVVRISNLHKPDFRYWHYSGHVKESWVVRKDDILFSWAGVASSIDCVRYQGEEALLNQHIYNLIIDDIHRKSFIYYYLQSYLPVLRTEIEGGAGQLHLTKSKIQSIYIPLPEQNELKKILVLMERQEMVIDNYKNERDKLHLIKNGLMRDLLTGKTRVTSLFDQQASSHERCS